MSISPVRTLVLLVVEALIVWVSFVLGTVWGREDWLASAQRGLFIEGNYLKILGVTAMCCCCRTGWTCTIPQSRRQVGSTFRLVVLGLVAFSLAAVDLAYMKFWPGQAFLPGEKWGLLILGVMFLRLAGGLRLDGAATLFS